MARAFVEKKYQYVYEGIKLDPFTSAQLTLSEIRKMTDELIEANSEYLKDFI